MAADLPRELADAVQRLIEDVPPRDLRQASLALSTRYREKQERRAPVARARSAIVAYAATRLPATYAATVAAFEAVREVRPDWQPRTLLDLGAGPGTGLWSAATTWPSLQHASAVEAEAEMIVLGQELTRAASHSAIRGADWVQSSVTNAAPEGPFDLVLLAYVLGELDPASQDRAIDRAADATAEPDGLTVVIEPGTPEGYARVLRARDRLLARGGFTVAPCPHDDRCPMAGRDWCHFSVRLPRTAAHRAAKGADLGYEDEKFSYVAVARQPTLRSDARVVRHPLIRPGVIQLELCTPDGLQTAVVTRSDRERFKRARKTDWGGSFDGPGVGDRGV